VLERTFFEQVLDAVEGFVDDGHGPPVSTAHRRGLKVWFDDSPREHYEAQLIRLGDEVALEIGFHSEYPRADDNQSVLDHLQASEARWRPVLGDEAEIGDFIGAANWRRVSELWEPPSPDDPESPIEIAARLADYVNALEPCRARSTSS
jgi:hypothetical protein